MYHDSGSLLCSSISVCLIRVSCFAGPAFFSVWFIWHRHRGERETLISSFSYGAKIAFRRSCLMILWRLNWVVDTSTVACFIEKTIYTKNECFGQRVTTFWAHQSSERDKTSGRGHHRLLFCTPTWVHLYWLKLLILPAWQHGMKTWQVFSVQDSGKGASS